MGDDYLEPLSLHVKPKKTGRRIAPQHTPKKHTLKLAKSLPRPLISEKARGKQTGKSEPMYYIHSFVISIIYPAGRLLPDKKVSGTYGTIRKAKAVPIGGLVLCICLLGTSEMSLN